MKTVKNQRSRDLRDIGQVVSLIDMMHMAREMSSCCIGTEALLETKKHRNDISKRSAEEVNSDIRPLIRV